MPYKDPEQRKANKKKHYEENKDRYRQWGRDYRERNPNCRKEEFQKLKADPTKYLRQKKFGQRYLRVQREKVIAMYGGCCACCGESAYEFMSIDHIGGGGSRDRKVMNSSRFYLYLLELNAPRPGYRILCHNCNMATKLGQICPHQRK